MFTTLANEIDMQLVLDESGVSKMFTSKHIMANLDAAFVPLFCSSARRPGFSPASLASQLYASAGTLTATSPPRETSMVPYVGVRLDRDASGRLFGGSADESWFGSFVLPEFVRDGETVEVRPGRWGIVRTRPP